MMNNNNQARLYNQSNVNRRRLYPQDRPRTNNQELNNNIPNPSSNVNNRNNNINQNRISNINSNENNELSKAFLIIQRELKKKDNRISELEKKIRELTNKINSLTNNNNNARIPKPSTMMEERNDLYNNNIEENKGLFNNKLNKNGYNYGYINKNNNIRNNSQQRAYQVNNLNYNSDSENFPKRYQGYDNLSYSNDNSVLTYNGIHSTNSKKDVKDYLTEVKAKIEQKKFKEFIRNIKLLTSKSEIAPNKEQIVESMRNLFGKEHLDLFLRFEKIIGVGK
jgi:polyhydroxyalkanoate synthesis regulator phasin